MIDQQLQLGWLGTGRMGFAMASRLLDAGHSLAVWNRTPAKAAPLTEKGAVLVETPADLSKTADIVFVIVGTPADLETVILGPEGILSGTEFPSIVIDCSTVDYETSVRVRQALAKKNILFLASPVVGNPSVVSAGDAIFAVSGPRVAFDKSLTVLETIAKRAVWTGENEQARLVKLSVNLFLGAIVQSLSEVTTLVEKSGVPREAFLDFLNNTVLAVPWIEKRTGDLLALDWTPTMTMELLRKDFDLGLRIAREQEITMPLAANVHQLIQAAVGRGKRDLDFLSLFAHQAESSGMTVEPRTAG